MNFRFVVFVVFLFGVSSFNLFSQTIHTQWLDLNPLIYVDSLPKYISKTKSIAVVVAKNREDGQNLAHLFHPIFIKSGIDPVSYYHVDDLFANAFISKKLSEEFVKRDIKYMVVLSNQQRGYEIVITPFSKSESFINAGGKAWRMQNIDAKIIGKAIYALSYSFERQNLLVVDQPEFRPINSPIKGQRLEAFKPDLRSETLYIPLFEKHVPDSTIVYSNEALANITQHNNGVDQKNEELKSLFSEYPFPYSFIEGDLIPKELMKNNIRYVLDVVHTTNHDIRSVLNYKEKITGVTEYVTVSMDRGQGKIKRISANAPTYKYYIKHLPSNSYYLGTKWDADLSWQEALQNHIGLLVAEISR